MKPPVLQTLDGKPVYPANPSTGTIFTTRAGLSVSLRPVTADAENGALNNRATKAHAEKELGQPLAWS